MASGKIAKIIARLEERIAEGQFYEAQQQTRVVAARYIKCRSWDAAVNIIHGVAQAMLRAGQGGSGGDLAILLINVYRQAEIGPDAASKGRLLTCLRLFPSAEPTRKKFINEMIAWSAKPGPYPAGDPELHHVVGTFYADEHETYEAERHLVLGTKDSAERLARLEYAWHEQDAANPHHAPLYCARAVLPYLLVANLRAANAAYKCFTSALVDAVTAPTKEVAGPKGTNLRVFPSLPLLNFLGMLLLAVQRDSPDLFRQLLARYATHLADLGGAWDEALEMIAEIYFDIQRPRQSNPLLDMMGSLLNGGSGSGSGNLASGQRRVLKPTAIGPD